MNRCCWRVTRRPSFRAIGAKGAEAIEASAPRDAVIIMDDGLQNPALAKSISIAVVDRDRGFGNGYVIPAGPLRAPLAAQIGLADLIVMTGRGGPGDTPPITALRGMTSAPFVKAETRATAAAVEMKGRKVVAYAGIANPQRFFSMLDGIGANIVERHTFADHHVFSDAEARASARRREPQRGKSCHHGKRSRPAYRSIRPPRRTQKAISSAGD